MIVGDVIPVTFHTAPADNELIVDATAVLDPSGTILAPRGIGAAWLLDQSFVSPALLARASRELWVALRGDFVVDRRGRAIDAEFVRAKLRTGDRPAGSNFGIQGGLFESWFELAPGG
jgi:hypothetical protein